MEYKKWKEKYYNKEKHRLAVQKYRHSHPEQTKIYNDYYYKSNIDKKRAQARKSYKKRYTGKNCKIRKQQKIYEMLNKELVRKRKNKWNKENPDKVKLYQKRGRKKNALKIRERNKRYKLRKKKVTIDKVNYDILYELTPFCFYCNCNLERNQVHFDHYIPIIKGGTHEKNNIRISCAPCNLHKGAKMPEEFYNSIYYKELTK